MTASTKQPGTTRFLSAPISAQIQRLRDIQLLPLWLVLFVFTGMTVMIFFSPQRSNAAETLNLNTEMDAYPLGWRFLESFEDPSGTLTIQDILAPQTSSRFRLNQQAIPNFGMTDSVFWFRFTLDVKSKDGRTWFLVLNNPLVDRVDLYVRQEDGSFRSESAGLRQDTENRSRLPALAVSASSSPQTFYLRAHEPGRAVFPLALMTPEAMAQAETREALLMVGYVAVMLTVLLLAFLLFLMKGEPEYLLFVLVIFFMSLFNLTIKGYLFQFLPDVALHFHHIITSWLGCVIVVSLITLGRRFLKGRHYAPKTDRILSLCASLVILVGGLVPFLKPTPAGQLLGNISMLATLGLAWLAFSAYRKGFYPALYYLIPVLLLVTSGLWMRLVAMTILPFNSIALHYITLHSLSYVLFIGLAFASNVRDINRHNLILINDLNDEVRQRTAASRALVKEIATRKSLEREVIRISDEERRSISHELHDGLCQQLVGARLRFAALEDQFAAAGLSREVQPLGRLLGESVDDAYRLSRGLWSTDSAGAGSMIDLPGFTRKLAADNDIDIQYAEFLGCHSCECGVLQQVQRIIREALVNAVKHAGARHIRAQLHCRPHGIVRLEVDDDGCGLSSKSDSGQGMGLKIMRYRAEMIGGLLEVDNAKGGGCQVVCQAPCGQGGEHNG